MVTDSIWVLLIAACSSVAMGTGSLAPVDEGVARHALDGCGPDGGPAEGARDLVGSDDMAARDNLPNPAGDDDRGFAAGGGAKSLAGPHH